MLLSENVWLYGSEDDLPPVYNLRAGTLRADWSEGVLRNLCVNDTRVLQRIYSAVRDADWNTIAGVITIVEEQHLPHESRLVFDSVHQQNDIDFRWRGTLVMTADRIQFDLDGTAHSTFKRNRVGFCVLHDASVAGSACNLEFTDGTHRSARFPDTIAPHQPFLNLRAITHEPTAGLRVTVQMEGDTFETEDQRNWTDASFKTYCTPQELPAPVEITTGTRIQQRITLTFAGSSSPVETANTPVLITRTDARTLMPLVGVQFAGDDLDEQHISWLRTLRLSHLRVETDPTASDWEMQLSSASQFAADIHAMLEVVVWLSSDDTQVLLERVAKALQPLKASIARVLIFHRQEAVTSADTLRLARAALPNVAIFGGTEAVFTDLNRNRPDPNTLDGIVWSANPQVHTFDNASLLETVTTQGEQLDSARLFSGGKSLIVSPITLKKRSTPLPVSAAVLTHETTLPPHADPRQMSLFAAVWTVGSLKHNAEHGAASLTCFSTHGYDGMIAYADGSPLPDQFPDVRGVYPLYHVFRALANLTNAYIIGSKSSHPRQVETLILEDEQYEVSLIANYTLQPQTVQLAGIRAGCMAYILNSDTVKQACDDPQTFWDAGTNWTSEGNLIPVMPYSVLVLVQTRA